MKKRRIKLSFSKEEMRSSLKLGYSGISTPLVSNTKAEQIFNVGPVMESFGLLGSSGDPNKFYPNLDVPKDIMPKPEDFIRVPFRLLSATVVGAGSWKATDFSNEVVLQGSLQKLLKKPIFTEHNQDMLNWVGIIEGVSWDKANGDVPSGINGLLAIDGITNPKIARGVLIGAIFSNSVTVEFDWVQSHTFSDYLEFEDKVGTIHPDDNKMIRRVVTNIHDYHETSLVWLGADPYAKLVDKDGELVNIDKASTYKLEKDSIKDKYIKNSTYSIPFALNKNIISLSQSAMDNINENEYKKSTTSNENDMDKKIELALKELLGVKEEDQLTVEQLNKLAIVKPDLETKAASFNKLTCLNDKDEEDALDNDINIENFTLVEKSKVKDFIDVKIKYKDYKNSIEAKLDVKENDNILEKIEKLFENSEIGLKSLEDKRKECKRLYSLSVENKTDDTIIELIEEANPKRLSALINQYSKEATDKFTGSCKACGSKNVEFKSSEEGEEVSSSYDDGDEYDYSYYNYQNIRAKHDNPTMIINKKR